MQGKSLWDTEKREVCLVLYTIAERQRKRTSRITEGATLTLDAASMSTEAFSQGSVAITRATGSCVGLELMRLHPEFPD